MVVAAAGVLSKPALLGINILPDGSNQRLH